LEVTTDPYSVSIVLDRSNELSLLRDLSNAGPVWIVDTPTNQASAQNLWAEFPTRNHLDGITVFDTSADRAPEQMLMDQMDTIDLHHGVYSADPPYTAIRVIGSKLTPEGRQFLETFGFDSFTLTDEGFIAVRPLPPALEVEPGK
jgi:hypothetical protein